MAYDEVIRRHDISAFGYYWWGEKELITQLRSQSALAVSRLAALGRPGVTEGDVKTAMAMKIFDLLGAGGMFVEFFAVDHAGDFLLMGHDGPSNVNRGRRPAEAAAPRRASRQDGPRPGHRLQDEARADHAAEPDAVRRRRDVQADLHGGRGRARRYPEHRQSELPRADIASRSTSSSTPGASRDLATTSRWGWATAAANSKPLPRQSAFNACEYECPRWSPTCYWFPKLVPFSV